MSQFPIETDHSEFRVLRAKLAAQSRVPTHDERSGLIAALAEAHLRHTTSDKKFRDTHLAASGRPCEFLYVETKPPAGPIPGHPPA